MTNEQERLLTDAAGWRRWGPYLSERAWGTVREDYSAGGQAWQYFSHNQARSRAYRWNEDGLAGICDDGQKLCFALALWNGTDPILKERFFGLTGPEGNHGEDVKEYYYYLDSTPTHSYMKVLYKYPQAAFPYERLLTENERRGKDDPEFELLDSGVFDEDRYFDVFIEYAKASPDDILIRIEVANRGPEAAEIHLLPTVWFRNTWSWQADSALPSMAAVGSNRIAIHHPDMQPFVLNCQHASRLLFTENNTNLGRLYGVPNVTAHVKDAFHEHIIGNRQDAVNPAQIGTKAAAWYTQTIPARASAVFQLRLVQGENKGDPWLDFDEMFVRRQQEADAFYKAVQPVKLDDDTRSVQRQAFAGMLWSKQFYHYDVDQWLAGDPDGPPPPVERRAGRNAEWEHLNTHDVISMPDKWEYPWFAAWDLAFHCIPLALLDAEFAKNQLVLLLREWYQHPNGQIPAYEWSFGDVNPPVLGWAAWRVYQIDAKQSGKPDRAFLERVFHKLMLNFTWWVNRKDAEGRNIFQGGFLGLDNIGVFDRSTALPTGGHLEQSDGTSWMAMFCLNLMTIALELALANQVYEDIATKFFEHFLYIAGAMNNIGGEGIALWDDQDEFFYDVLHAPHSAPLRLKVRSLVGLIPLLAVETIEPELLDRLPGFKIRLEWFLTHRAHLASLVSRWQVPGAGQRHLLAMVRGHRMKGLLRRALDPAEFLSDYGIRSVSKVHQAQPYGLTVNGSSYMVGYEPAESRSGLFGGNSNWRGPIWFPINYLLIESLQKFHEYYSEDFKVECPTGSGQYLTMRQIGDELSERLISIFKDNQHERPFNGSNARLQNDPHWKPYVLFHEYFHGDTGAGLGASHQTGWTGLVAMLIQNRSQGSE